MWLQTVQTFSDCLNHAVHPAEQWRCSRQMFQCWVTCPQRIFHNLVRLGGVQAQYVRLAERIVIWCSSSFLIRIVELISSLFKQAILRNIQPEEATSSLDTGASWIDRKPALDFYQVLWIFKNGQIHLHACQTALARPGARQASSSTVWNIFTDKGDSRKHSDSNRVQLCKVSK